MARCTAYCLSAGAFFIARRRNDPIAYTFCIIGQRPALGPYQINTVSRRPRPVLLGDQQVAIDQRPDDMVPTKGKPLVRYGGL